MADPHAVPSLPYVLPYTLVVPTVYGQMLVNRHDINQTNALFKTGCAPDHADVLLAVQVLQLLGGNGQGNGLTALDIGANFGVYTHAMARAVGPGGVVHAFEAQRILFQMLAGSVALNSIGNVHCHHLAVGGEAGRVEIPQYDYAQPLNFGSIEFGGTQTEPLNQSRRHDAAAVEFVPRATVDSFEFPQVHFMKIDVEGMENQVLDGASATIARCRPVMYIEFLKVDREALRHRIVAMDYDVHENGINYLCVPKELAGKLGVKSNATG